MVIIKVDKAGNVVEKEWVVLNHKHDEVVFWVCEDRTKNLFIDFDVPDASKPPFESMTPEPATRRHRVYCHKWMCFSRGIHKDYDNSDKGYKYWQTLQDPVTGHSSPPVDGRIIIKP